MSAAFPGNSIHYSNYRLLRLNERGSLAAQRGSSLASMRLHGTLRQWNLNVFPIIHCNWISHGAKWRYDHVERNLMPWSWHCYCQRVKYGLQLALQYAFSLLLFHKLPFTLYILKLHFWWDKIMLDHSGNMRDIILFKSLRSVRFVSVFERSVLCSPRLHLFDHKYSKKGNLVKYSYY